MLPERRASHALIMTKRKRRTATRSRVLKDIKRNSIQKMIKGQKKKRLQEKRERTGRKEILKKEKATEKEEVLNNTEMRKLLLQTVRARRTTAEDATTGEMTATAEATDQERDARTGNTRETGKPKADNLNKESRKTAMRLRGSITGIAAAGKILAAMVLAHICLACSQPVKEYSFATLNRLKGWQNDTGAVIYFDMTDTLNACELYIVGEITTKRTVEKEKGYPVHITLVAPNGTHYKDSLFLPLYTGEKDGVSRTSHGIREIEWPYRKNIYNKIPGQWSIILTKGAPQEDYSNIIGLGIHCKQKEL